MQIAKLLQEEKVLNPTAYKRRSVSRPQVRKPLIRTIGTPTPLSTFWNGGSTQAVRSTSRPTPIRSGTRSSETPLENQAVFYDTHPAIIEQEIFDKVQEDPAAASPQDENRKKQSVLRHGLLC